MVKSKCYVYIKDTNYLIIMVNEREVFHLIKLSETILIKVR